MNEFADHTQLLPNTCARAILKGCPGSVLRKQLLPFPCQPSLGQEIIRTRPEGGIMLIGVRDERDQGA